MVDDSSYVREPLAGYHETLCIWIRCGWVTGGETGNGCVATLRDPSERIQNISRKCEYKEQVLWLDDITRLQGLTTIVIASGPSNPYKGMAPLGEGNHRRSCPLFVLACPFLPTIT